MHAAPLRDALPAHQQRLYRLPAGAELRCLRGTLALLEGSSDGCAAPHPWLLPTGQAWRAPHPVWLRVTAQDQATMEITWPAAVPAPKENRQGLAGLWRRWLQPVQRNVSRARRAA